MSHGAEQVPSEARCEVCGIALSMSRYGHRDGRCIIHVGCEIAGKTVVVYSEGSVQCPVYSVKSWIVLSPHWSSDTTSFLFTIRPSSCCPSCKRKYFAVPFISIRVKRHSVSYIVTLLHVVWCIVDVDN